MNKKASLLFDHYKQNLNMIREDSRIKMQPDRDDIVVCPLCFKKYFTIENIDEKHLTVEHAPPHSLNGKEIALTCQDCNNDQGSQLDSFLVSYINDLDALVGNGENYVDGDLTIDGGGKVRIEFRSNETGWIVGAIPQASHPKHVEFLNNQFKHGQINKLAVTLRITNPRRAKLALLRSAYLLAFGYLGYSFLINLNLGPIRYQFQHPHEDIFPLQAIQMFDNGKVPDNMLGINIIHDSGTPKSYFIVFDVQGKRSIPHRVGVMLPGPNPRDAKLFMDLKKIEYEEASITLRNFNISFEDKLAYPFLAHDIWNEI